MKRNIAIIDYGINNISSLQKDFYKHWKGYTKAPFPKDFEWEQINEIIDQGMRRSERYKKIKKTGFQRKTKIK